MDEERILYDKYSYSGTASIRMIRKKRIKQGNKGD